MQRSILARLHLIIMITVFASLCLLAVPAQAQAAAPMISVKPIWRPAQQLTTLDANGGGVTDSGDDIGYAAVDIYATSTVEFWAVGFTRTVNRLALQSYTQLGDPNSTEDDVAMITIGASWPSPYTFLPSDSVDSNGKFYFAITIQGEYTRPMGSNGVSKTLHIATLKYRIKKG